jgi:serine/threonine-protein kinase
MPEDNASAVPEDCFEQALAALLQAEERGERLDLSRVIRDTPELETPLREFFRNRDGFDRLAPDLGPTAARPAAPAAADLMPGSRLGGYEVLDELGHGGRGIVYRVADPELHRPLAVKVLRHELRDEGDAVRRFQEEAQVTGQLQHPGIAPVHAVGRLADGRPYFAMKLIQGRTLADLLAERPLPAHDQPRFLGIFQQVCQAVAYAHSKGVIHRDLKPANVMVGAFAEVQVMDWGLAKVLADGSSDGPKGETATRNAIRTVRTEAAGIASQDGMVAGTFAYMAPEQAKGQVDLADRRADVFGLGAVLCEVLTGLPPYAGAPAWRLHLMAAEGDLADAFSRLDRCEADADLVALTRDCLAGERERRPRDAGAIAARLAAHLAGVQERLRRAELEKVAAQARAREERRRRRWQVTAVAVVLLTLAAVGGAGLWWDRQRAEVQRAGSADMDRVWEFQHSGQWADARATLERVEGRLGGGGSPDLRQRIRQAWADLEMVASIDEARVPQSPLGLEVAPPTMRTAPARQAPALPGPLMVRGPAGDEAVQGQAREAPALPGPLKEGMFSGQAEADYAEAFRKYGLDLPALDPVTAAERIAASHIREPLLAALDDWAMLKWKTDPAGRDHLLAIARRVDADAWRNLLRDRAVQGERQPLEELAGQPDVARQPPATLHTLALALIRVRAYAAATAMLQSAQRRSPGDFWINHDLGFCLIAQHGREREAAAYFQAALALRPQSVRVRRNLGMALSAQGRLADAEKTFRGILEVQPENAETYSSLGLVLDKQGKRDEAVAAFRRAIELKADSMEARGNLAMTLESQGKLEEALATHLEALAFHPKNPALHCNYGHTLVKLGRYPEARAAFEEAVRLHPDLTVAHLNLGAVLCDYLHDPDGALLAFQKCLDLDDAIADAHYGLGNAWADKKAFPEAIAAYQQAIGLKPDHAWAHCNLGMALAATGDLPGAVFEYRTALHIQPAYPEALNSLGNALSQQGNVKEAIHLHEQAVQLQPQEGIFHFNLGNAYRADGAWDKAIAEYRTTTELRPDFDGGWINLAGALRQGQALDESIAVWKEVIRRFPDRPDGHRGLGNALADKGLPDEAIAAYADAVHLKPDDALAQLFLGLALAAQGRLTESIAAYQEAAHLRPDWAKAHYSLGISLMEQGRYTDAAAAYHKAVAAPSDFAEAYCNLGAALQRTGQLADSLAAFQRGHELGSRNPRWNYPSLQWVREAEHLIALDRQLPEIVAGKLQPANADERQLFARLCHCKRHYEAAARLREAALDATPGPADAVGSDSLYNAACSAALAGCGVGADTTQLDDSQRTHRRRQALDWLRTGLDSWRKVLDRGKRQARATVERTLQRWQADPDLAGVRDQAGLARLPDVEREAWERIWADVEALRKQARETR